MSRFPPQFSHMDSFRSLDSAGSSFDIGLNMKKQYAAKAIRKNNRKFKKTNGKPKRPLSAYNIFFKHEREKLVKAKQKVGFANMAKLISIKWKEINAEDRKEFAAAAEVEQKKYRAAVSEWKANHKAEMEVQMRIAQQSSSQHAYGGAAPLGPLLGQTDPLVLQRLMLEQQLMQQRNIMQNQMHNAANFSGSRRMSMPNMNSAPPAGAPIPQQPFSNETFQQLLQQQQQIQQQQQQLQQSQATHGRRFSLPVQTLSTPQSSTGQDFEIALQDSFTADTQTQSSYDSSDDSSLDDETADFLINMPIMDMGQQQQQQEQEDKQQPTTVPSSVAASTPRRSSMPTLPSKTLENWDYNITPIMGGLAARRLSMPQLSDEMKEMQDILDMLDDDVPAFNSSTTSAA